MLKNVASQKTGAQIIASASGAAFTGPVTVWITGDGGTQTIGSVALGVCTHKGNGYHEYSPSQAETNYNHIAFTYVAVGAITQTMQLYTDGGATPADVLTQMNTALVQYDGPTDAEMDTSFISVMDEIAELVSQTDELTDAIDTIEVEIGNTGGGILNARIARISSNAEQYFNVVQGEEKVITFIVEANGRFDAAPANEIRAKFRDTAGTIVSKEDGDIERVCEELDVAIIRITLTEDETNSLIEGLLRAELIFDTQKAVLTQDLKIIEKIEDEGS